MTKQTPGREQLISELATLITEAVNLQHFDKSRITSETALTEGGLELDSVDILEVVVAVEHKFGIKVKDASMGKQYFRTFGTIAELVESKASLS